MNTKKWTKKDRIACTIIFVISILTFVVFLSTMTLSYFYDEHSASGVLTAGNVSIKVSGGSDGNGSIEFPEVLTPNTQYSVIDDTNLVYRVTNTGTSSIYLMLKLESTYLDIIRPTLISNIYSEGKYFVCGEGHSEYLFYMKAVNKNENVTLCTQWQVGNFTNDISGNSVDYKITAYAVQSEGGAIDAMIAGNVDGWQYAPEIFKTMAGVSL